MKRTRSSLSKRISAAFAGACALFSSFALPLGLRSHSLPILAFILVLSATCPLSGTEKKARLQYIPNIPVYLTSEVKLDIQQSLPGLSLATKGVQEVRAVLKVSEESTHMTAVQPPFDLSFVLSGIKIDLKVNDEALHFDSAEEGTSLFLNQVSKMLERPVILTVDKEYQISGESADLTQMTNELPVLKEVNPTGLLIELLQPIFSLGGEELTVGKTLERQVAPQPRSVLPQVLQYKIKEIDDYSVTAEISGELDKKVFKLSGEVAFADQEETHEVSVSLSGQMQGSVKWNRDNAMLHNLNIRYAYSAKFRLGVFEWLVTANLEVDNRTRRKAS